MSLSNATNTLRQSADSIGSATKDRVSNLGRTISSSVSPTKLASKGFTMVKSQVAQEMPEISSITASIQGYVNDVMSNIKSSLSSNSNDEKEQTQKLTQIKESSDESNDLTSKVVSFLATISSNIPYLESITEQLDDNNVELKTLVDMQKRGDVLSEQQIELLRKNNKLIQDEMKSKRFAKQKEESKINKVSNVKEKLDEKKAKDGKGVLGLFGLSAVLGRLVAPLLGIVAGLASITGLTKLMPKFMTDFLDSKRRKKVGSSKAGATVGKTYRDKKTGRFRKANIFERAGSKLSGVGKTASKFRGVATLGKGALRATGIGAIALMIGESIFGAVGDGIKSYLAGDEFKTVLYKTFRGAITAPIQSLFDLVGMMFGFESPDVKKIFDNIADGVKDIGVFFRDKLFKAEWWSTMFDNMISNVKNYFTSYVDKIENKISSVRDVFSNIIDSVVETFKQLARNVLSIVPDALIPDNVEKSLQAKAPAQKDIKAKQNNAQSAAKLILGQKVINDYNNEKNTVPDYLRSQQAQNNMINTPITQNVSNSTFVSPNIMTRNPISPVFVQNKVNY